VGVSERYARPLDYWEQFTDEDDQDDEDDDQ